MIKRINPLFLVGALFLILILLWVGVQSTRLNIEQDRIDLANYEAKAKGLKDLKSSWDSKKTFSKINSIISGLNLKSKTNLKDSPGKIYMDAKNLDKKQIDLLAKKILNETFEIAKINIKRIDDKNLELHIEVSK